MDHSKSGRAHLTDEQWAQRVAWAREVWGTDTHSREWLEVLECIHSLIDQGCLDYDEAIDMFRGPEAHPQTLDLLFEEYLSRKLIGDFT